MFPILRECVAMKTLLHVTLREPSYINYGVFKKYTEKYVVIIGKNDEGEYLHYFDDIEKIEVIG